MHKSGSSRIPAATFVVSCLLFLAAASAHAATLCVDAHGNSGCQTTINAAVTAASPGDTINVSSGTYAEDVHITKPLSLIGQNRNNTTIAANGHANGIYIDGFSGGAIAHVTVRGFTVENAQFEGMLVQNASDVTIADNIVRHNDQNLQIQNDACPGLPAFETNEGDDCGEGIHLMGVDHSIVTGNEVEQNAGGILISDETAPNHDNAVTHNFVHDNAYDCGITLASHPAYVSSGPPRLPFGMYHNTIADNESRHNGFGSAQGGAGVGIFAPGPGTSNVQNSVVHNRLIDNSMPGVSIHNHVNLTFPGHPPNPNVNDNVIVDNYISGNGTDSSIPTTVPTGISVLGVTPITGLVITGNTVKDENIDVAIKSASEIDLHLNSLEGKHIGVAELSAGGIVNATENWWGCSKGPNTHGCATTTGNVITTPWLTTPVNDDTPR
jgi:hypothetical protein